MIEPSQPPTLFIERLKEFVITVGYSGYAKYASGTFGSLAAAGVAGVIWAVLRLAQAPEAAWWIVLLAGVALACVLSVVWGAWALQRFVSGDPKPFVLDEFAGQWLALIGVLPLLGGSWTAGIVIFGMQFFFFRFFDVLKLQPAAALEKLPSGWGVLCDDLMAGVYANVLGQLVLRLSPLLAWIEAQRSSVLP